MEILQKYPHQERRLKKLFNWLDENGITLNDLGKGELELYFRTVKNAKNTGEFLKSSLHQVLESEGLPADWVQAVRVPYPMLYLSLSDALKIVDDYAKGYGAEKYKIETDGFCSVKAALILMWLGIPTQDAGYVLKSDVGIDSITYKGKVYPYVDSIAEFIQYYLKSDGYYAGLKPKMRYLPYKDEDYFLRSTRKASRDKIVNRLFEKLADLDITINDIQKAGQFQRAFDEELSGRNPNISENFIAEYEDYKKKKSAI